MGRAAETWDRGYLAPPSAGPRTGAFILAQDVFASERLQNKDMDGEAMPPRACCFSVQRSRQALDLKQLSANLHSTHIPVCLPFSLKVALWYGQQCYLHFVDEGAEVEGGKGICL